MLNVPTLWIVFVVNFMALSLVWTYVMRCYPSLHAARYWNAATLIAAGSAAFAGISIKLATTVSLTPLLASAVSLIFACCLAMMGIQEFYGRRPNWRATWLITLGSFIGIAVCLYGFENAPARILIYALAQIAAIAMTLPLLFSRHAGRINAGARLAGLIGIAMIGVHLTRSAAVVFDLGGGISFVRFNSFQATLVLLLVFLSMMWNFGFLLMAIDRLRNEVADLALLDDLTGTANRRRLLSRLDEECARSDRAQQPFSLLTMDLDGFKDINDCYGHAAGDECLRAFTQAVQSQLRTGDLLARVGGDEFCVVLPATTLREAAIVARHVVEACRRRHATWQGLPIAMTASVGVAQWRNETGLSPMRLLEAADEALYDAKKNGKNRYALENDAPLAKPLKRIA